MNILGKRHGHLSYAMGRRPEQEGIGTNHPTMQLTVEPTPNGQPKVFSVNRTPLESSPHQIVTRDPITTAFPESGSATVLRSESAVLLAPSASFRDRSPKQKRRPYLFRLPFRYPFRRRCRPLYSC